MEQLRRSKKQINKKLKANKYLNIFLCVGIAIIMIIIPLIFTPISSDDFIYITNNSEWSDISWRYMNWSGRLVADIASLILLQLPPIIYIFFKATVWVGMISLISQLPSIFNKSYTWNTNNFIVIFLLYWIANPNLGQTSFWTVGFTNYILTNFFIVLYLSSIFFFKDRRMKLWYFLIIPILGLLAGNSNENTSIVVVLLTVIFLLIEKEKKTFLLGLPFTIIGMLSLLLSPGQHERLQNPAFQVSREQTLFHRLWNYFSSPWFIETFKSFSWIFVTFILIGFIYLLRHQFPQKKNMIYSLIFFFSAIMANAAFGGSYVFPVALRSLNGSLVLFLISIAFFLSDLLYMRVTLSKRSITYLIALLCLPFMFTYYYATKSVISLRGQFDVREQAILDGKKRNQKSIYIPNYYVGKLYNPSDSIDMFQGDLNSYYDIDGSTKIVLFDKDFSFDYGNKNLVNTKQTPLNEPFGRGVRLKSINIFPDERTINQYSINLTFDNNLLELYPADEFLLFIHVNWKRDSLKSITRFNADISLNNQLSVNGKYIFSSPIDNIRPQDISSVDVGIYNPTTKINSVKYTINMEK
ncbi:DUF6056 family protein [Enterococcus avium]|uniref:DUF6056 family protein n=1 Tax=Enterococcus avium TaxID=33945 RepID=UPI001D085B04|nr:DUF6056 family protein [Enterococcus avium]MCB6917130.1 DUF6056 family protein [Enterococcus avium]MCQ4961223.1 DUF6056 family protein [Enterococcus avium]